MAVTANWGAHSTQVCLQDQAAPQDTSKGGCRHQGVSLPQPTGTPRASPAGWMEGTAQPQRRRVPGMAGKGQNSCDLFPQQFSHCTSPLPR